MTDSLPFGDGSPSSSGLGTLVGGYVRRRLHRGVHPAFDTLRNKESANDLSDVQPSTGEIDRVSCSDPHRDESLDSEDKSADPLYEVFLLFCVGKKIWLHERTDLTTEAVQERERFQTAVTAYEKTTYGTTFQTDIDISRTQTWEELLSEVNKASEAYHSNSGAWNKIRKGFHKFGDNNKAFDAWLGLLPSGSDWSSMLIGGLRIIIRVHLPHQRGDLELMCKCNRYLLGYPICVTRFRMHWRRFLCYSHASIEWSGSSKHPESCANGG